MSALPGAVDDIAAGAVLEALAARRAAHSLPGVFYGDSAVHALDLANIWHREWIFAGHACELPAVGDFLTLTVGAYPLIVVRVADGSVRALHNVCRHRGFTLCETPHGAAKRRFVCPYHQWSYELDGRLAKARSMPAEFDTSGHGLGTAHCAEIGGLLFVCVAPRPPDLAPMREVVEPFVAPFDLGTARVAHETVAVEQGNWKLVMENNRECFHCRTAHPELCATFPEGSQHAGGVVAADEPAIGALVDMCEGAGLPGRFLAAADWQYRVMRLPLIAGARSMTMDGAPAVARRFGGLPDIDVGDALLYHYPSTWNHFMADHAITFRILPVGPRATELRTTWLVPGDAVEGRDYDRARLTAVWEATNRQDTMLVERTQRGVSSPAYRPGPYARPEEIGVIQFVDWYAATIVRRIIEQDGPASRAPRPFASRETASSAATNVAVAVGS